MKLIWDLREHIFIKACLNMTKYCRAKCVHAHCFYKDMLLKSRIKHRVQDHIYLDTFVTGSMYVIATKKHA